jgi:hypothetical protein
MPEHIKEPLKRSNRFIEDYTQWPKNELVDLNLYIQNLISEAEAEGTTWPWITYMNNPKSRGLIFHAHEELPEFNWQYLMESIKDSLMKVHTYILQHSLNERKLVAKDVHSKEVYYLKPRPSFDDSQKLIQQYGNIRLEYRHINDRVHRIPNSGHLLPRVSIMVKSPPLKRSLNGPQGSDLKSSIPSASQSTIQINPGVLSLFAGLNEFHFRFQSLALG